MISKIQKNEANLSVRTKLNTVIDLVVGSQNVYKLPFDFDLTTVSTITQSVIVLNNSYDLGGATINFGSKKTIYFNGYTISNAVLTGSNCQIVADKVNIFGSGVTFTGTWINDIYPEWWALPNTTDWQIPLQNALDKARISSGRVVLSSFTYQYYNQLTVYEGVSIVGKSRGETALGSGPTKGSVLHSLGDSRDTTIYTNIGLKVVGRMVTIKDITIKGRRSVARYGDGIVIYGVGDGTTSQSLIENCSFENLIIHGFQKGKGLYLVAGNSGAITYCKFDNIRIRDCETHLKIESLSSKPSYGNIGSTGLPFTAVDCFINSNIFSGLYLSGYCVTGLHVVTQMDTDLANSQIVYRPANNLIFTGVVIEPPYSANSHIRIEGGGSSVRMSNIRVEALRQETYYPSVPVVYLAEETSLNVIDCDQMSVPILNLGNNNRINGHSLKNAEPSPDSYNLFMNSSFVGLDKTLTDVQIPNWSIQEQYLGTPIDQEDSYFWRNLQSNSNVLIEYDTTNFIESDYKVLKITVPPNYQFRMFQNIDRDSRRLPSGKVNCFLNAKNEKDVIWTYQDSVTPIVSGGPCFGGNRWEGIGAYFPITNSLIAGYYRIAIFCQNYTEEDIVFSITMPSFVVGELTPFLPAKPITENGGTFYAPISSNPVLNIKPVSNSEHRASASSSDVLLPLEGNYFEINEDGFYIQKINATTNRFAKGTQITLYFNYADISIISSSFIDLFKPFVSDIGSSITLISVNGDGLWKEVSRIEKKQRGYYTATASSIMSGVSLELPDTTSNIFSLSAGATVSSIQRINYTKRFSEGSDITLLINDNDNGYLQFQNTDYITLRQPIAYVPTTGDWIKFETVGDGTWFETSRSPKKLEPAYNGYSVFNIPTLTSGKMYLPITGERYFEITNTSVDAKTIQRINQDVNRFPSGTELTLIFSSITSDIVLSNNLYISLRYGTTYVPKVGDWIKLITNGDGTWLETDRKKEDYRYNTIGYTASTVSSLVATNFMTLPVNGPNYFGISNTGTASQTIQRINFNTKFNAGSEILLYFDNVTSPILLSNSAYINLRYGTTYVPKVGDWIKLVTVGDGTWIETDRKKQDYAYNTLGYTASNVTTSVATNYLTLTTDGPNYFGISNTGTASQLIQRINYDNRFTAGSEILLYFETLTSSISLVHSAYISLAYNVNFSPVVGDWIKLITNGDGTWRELTRKPSALIPPDLTIVLSATYLASNFLTLPMTGENYFKLSCATTGGLISRINNAASSRFPGGKIIMIEFTNITVAPTLVNSGYLILTGGINYTPALNGGIVLYTRGDGTWRELSRF